MPLSEETYSLQKEFVEMCRTGDFSQIKGSRLEALQTYRRLVYSNIEANLCKAYPITKELLTQKEWEGLIQAFFASYPIRSPHLWEMPKDLFLWLQKEDHPLTETYPFLCDLLYFEWLEIEFFVMPDKDSPPSCLKGHLIEDLLVFNPEHQIFSFSYPVFKENIREAVSCEGHYFLLVYRTQSKKDVRYFELSPLYVFLWEEMKNKGLTVAEGVKEAGIHFPQIDEKRLLPSAIDFFQKLLEEEAVLGFSPS